MIKKMGDLGDKLCQCSFTTHTRAHAHIHTEVKNQIESRHSAAKTVLYNANHELVLEVSKSRF